MIIITASAWPARRLRSRSTALSAPGAARSVAWAFNYVKIAFITLE